MLRCCGSLLIICRKNYTVFVQNHFFWNRGITRLIGSVVHAAEINWKWTARSVLWLRICRKCVCGRSFALNPTRGAHDAHPDLVVGWGGDIPPRLHPTRRLDRSGLPPVDIISGYTSARLRYFPAGPWLLSQPKRSPPWPIPNYTILWHRHKGVRPLRIVTCGTGLKFATASESITHRHCVLNSHRQTDQRCTWVLYLWPNPSCVRPDPSHLRSEKSRPSPAQPSPAQHISSLNRDHVWNRQTHGLVLITVG